MEHLVLKIITVRFNLADFLDVTRRPLVGRESGSVGRFPVPPLDSMAAGDENRHRESSMEAWEGRPLALSPDESSEEELLQVRVRGGK